MTPPLIALAAGGSGGHVFPAEALAAALLSKGFRLTLITDARGDSMGGQLGKLETHLVRAGGLAGKKSGARIASALALLYGTVQSRRLLHKLRPSVVVGFGGYASVPAMLAATYGGFRTILHEQNAILGRANRLLAPRVMRIATSFQHQEGLSEQSAPRVVHTGLPVRTSFIDKGKSPYRPPEDEGPLRLLVLGGSQGARSFSDIIPTALAMMPTEMKDRLSVIQQCRTEDLAAVKSVYQKAGITAQLAPFFEDVATHLAECHLLIGRAGASTIGEATVVGRPTVLVPYPHAIDDHQTRNAHAVDDAGGGWLLPEDSFHPEKLRRRLEDLFSTPSTLVQAAACARAMGRADAAQRLADLVAELTTNDLEARR